MVHFDASILGMVTSEAAFRALPDGVQTRIQSIETDLMKKWHKEGSESCKVFDDKALAELKKKGANILAPFPLADQKRLAQAGYETWVERAKALGPEGVAIQQKLEVEWKRTEPKP
jgi:TRAP-type C4-dicarboxylate transport system substrate-binding protein